MYKRNYGSSGNYGNEFFSDIIFKNNQYVLIGSVAGNGKDGDLEGIVGLVRADEGVIIKMDLEFNTIWRSFFIGTNAEQFYKITRTNDNYYIIVGNSNSKDYDMEGMGFTTPNSQYEAIILKYDNIYTSNDPTKDLLGWCTSSIPYIEGNTSNYYYGSCLNPFNTDDIKLLVEKETNIGLKIYQGEYEYPITIFPDNQYSWYLINFFYGSGSGNIEISNLKLKFSDGYIGHIIDAINKGYIEPLVIVNSVVYIDRPISLLPTVIDIINTNGKTGIGNHPIMNINIKPKKSELRSIIFNNSKEITFMNDGLRIYELRNFDMSITPTN